jgi:hypothetical protein
MRGMGLVEQRFLATCLAGVYMPPEQRGQDWKGEYEPAYFVSLEPIQGDTISYGPFSLAEAYERFEATHLDFDGGSVAPECDVGVGQHPPTIMLIRTRTSG